MSVFKAALLGVPLPLCSCGVLPAALSLKKQGANNGATTAFMISTPESGVDSIAITYALLDPIMTVARPLVAFVTAAVAGLTENLLGYRAAVPVGTPAKPFSVADPGGTMNDVSGAHPQHRRLGYKVKSGLHYAFSEFWGDLAGWFFLGIFLAGLITALIPDDVFSRYLGSGFSAMLLMLAVGIPLYICATASTPIAAALILKGVSPGAALVFLVTGPATNAATVTTISRLLGKRAVVIYLVSICGVALAGGLLLDHLAPPAHHAAMKHGAATAGAVDWVMGFLLLGMLLPSLGGGWVGRHVKRLIGRADHGAKSTSSR